MSNQSRGNQIQDKLARAVALHCLPDDVQERAEKLLHRLQQPVRIALMGLPGSGKSALLNLLVGADVLSDGVRLPTLQLSFGATTQSVCTLSDGTKQTLPHADVHKIEEVSPVFVEIQMPLPALGKVSVLEVVAPKDPTALQRASNWAAKRCDVALWCTQGFGEIEQATWTQMPDLIKDHGFLMITKADVLKSNGLMEATLGNVQSVARHEFNQIIPISTIDALAARKPDGSVNKEQLRASGGLALISAVLKQVELGRQSTVDLAEVLLVQNNDTIATAIQLTEEGQKSESVPPRETFEQQEISTTVAETETSVTPNVAAGTPAQPTDETSTSGAVVTLHPATRDAYEHVLDYIISQSQALIELAAKMGGAAPAQIMAKTVEHVQWLSDYLNEHGDDADPALARARETAMDAADLVQLMQMEKRDSAAIEALSLMIQIKHELQAELAA